MCGSPRQPGEPTGLGFEALERQAGERAASNLLSQSQWVCAQLLQSNLTLLRPYGL